MRIRFRLYDIIPAWCAVKILADIVSFGPSEARILATLAVYFFIWIVVRLIYVALDRRAQSRRCASMIANDDRGAADHRPQTGKTIRLPRL